MAMFEQLFTHTPDELFEKFSIHEIEFMQNGLQKEIDKKKDELRILVGEKYRDFIEVIDKISVMNDLAVSITNRIDSVSSDLTDLNSKQQDSTTTIIPKKRREHENDYSVAISIKLLIDIEDQIWFEINRCKFMRATELLQLALHIKTVLHLETTWRIDQHFPVVYDLWNSILRFPVVLTNLIEEKLKSTELSAEIAGECLCALSILENLTCVNIIKRFLALRIETLKTTLNSENVSQNVRVRILNSYQIIINTFEVLYHCFKNSESDNGLFWIQIENLTSLQREPVLNFVKLDNTSTYGKIYIPDVIQNFRIKMTNQPIPLDASIYHECINEWLSWVRIRSTQHISPLLNLIGSLKTLHLLQESVPPLPQEWPMMLNHFSQDEKLDLWNELYEPVILDQAKKLLFEQWNAVFDRIRDEIESLMKKIIENRIREPEDNLHWFLWDSLEEDLTTRSTGKRYIKNVEDLTVKSLGLSPNVGKICVFLESLVSNMVDELSNMNSGNDLDSEQSTILKRHQQLCCLEMIEKLLNHVWELTESSAACDGVTLFLARFLSGVPPLCSSLKQCIILIDDEKGDEWSTVNVKLQECSLNVWRKWSNRTSAKLIAEYDSTIKNSNTSAFRMKHVPKWDAITIRQENEDGVSVESEVKVPFQASFPIQELLNSLAYVIGSTLPPRLVTAEMINDILGRILQCFLESCSDSINQAINIQFLFDVKYLSSLLVPIENELLITKCYDTIHQIENKIDPVDLDSIIPYLSENVTQFAFKTQGLYGLLMSYKSRINVDSYADNANDPNVVYIGGTNVPWFPLLPVSTMNISEKK